MDVNEHERLLNITLRYKVKERGLYCCPTFHSHSMVFNNEHSSYPKISVKRPLAQYEYFT
jgi:hypothetical protein